ncbi:cytochrome d ubiquinol oxidase subunit II [Agrococcus sediminis]|uniref:Cytochrome d ubiquinol oxidase subunit II n=1 Tax=Agrococcus sediminis TaxID=2599924 RepID=A0A5M8QG66_9MICO|nr:MULTISPECIES: cytochrome d ubiquinol oxidase subunit II [Agrococcus]KAA6433893.1 cytochrome d ubiquinol oxidase subunit II [Agrococcus sediminis]MDR7234454.1 cytochrome d ubiquinol oxidase subunit II [Agrococcus sp. BE272]RWR23815.1 cytochrome d ubiquinol oxidase subunit II [Agrococcus lahaulensis]UOW00658.1 cytochrome d ubiquinol oxidase subunit II [Agrococcus sp. SCSIO52902]
MDLSLIWFLLIGFMFVMYFVLDGFDFGVGMSLPVLGRSETDRRRIINAIGPVWDLNETWLIVAGASLFAAFPEWYATMFSGFFLALLVLLLGLIVRAVSFEFRHQRDSARWRAGWDLCIVVGSAIPALLWGVAFASLAQGLPMEPHQGGALMTGGLLSLLSPYALLGGITTLGLFLAHGAVFLALKTDGDLKQRAHALAGRALLGTGVVAVVFLAWTVAQNPTPLVVVLSALAAVALVGAWLMNGVGRDGRAFALTAATVAFAVLALFGSLLTRAGGPFVMPASNPTADFVGLTVANASSSPYTLEVMTWAALICLPLVLAYQAWTYWVFRRRVTVAAVEAAAH